MKVLLLNGSCKANGSTFTALTEVAKVLENNGIETEIFQIGANPVRDCIGCGQCTTKCKFDAISLERRYDVQFGAFEQMPIQVAKYAVKRTGKILASAAKK